MKINIYSLLLILAFAGPNYTLTAHHWRVSNLTGSVPQFSTIQSAHDASGVLSGDTLYLEPSNVNYGDLTWTKKLVIIGNGYFLAGNPQTQANTTTSKLSTISIYHGASNATITGCEIGNINLIDTVSSVYIRRNLIGNISFNGSYPGSHIHIIQNYITSGISGSCSFSNSSIENNFIKDLNLSAAATATILNNVIGGSLGLNSCTLRNNIATCTSMQYPCGASLTNCSLHNNIGATTQFGTTNGNMSNVDMGTVFVCQGGGCSTYSSDGMFQLKQGSVAAGAGYGGIDCGMFAGNYPYVLSGMPPVPAIYFLNVQPQGDAMNVSVKIKSHN